MSVFAQAVIVGFIVTSASLYALLTLMPAAWRRWLASLAARYAAHWGLSEADARRVEAKLSTGGACGSCDTCKACATPPDKAGVAIEPATYRTIPIERATSASS